MSIPDQPNSEQFLRIIMDNMVDMVNMLDANGIFYFVSPSHERILGYRPEEMIGTNAYEYLHAEDKERVVSSFINSLATGIAHEIFRFRHKDGRYMWLEASSNLIYDSQGIFAGVVVGSRDVTKRKEAEERLRESEENFRSIYNNAIDGIFQSTPEGRFLSVNQAFARIFGYASPEEMITAIADISVHYYVNQEDRKRYVKILEEQGSIEGFEFKARRKDGKEIWISNNTWTIYDINDRIIRFEGSVKDITEQKSLALQLLQAQKMEAVGTMAGGIAHDFNNILSSMIGYTELAMCEPDEKERLSDLQQVLRSCDRAKSLISRILAFSRISAVDRRLVDLSNPVREAVKLLRSATPTTIQIRLNIASNDTTAMADLTQMHQVVMNLCTNAVHAMRETGGVLEVNLTPLDAGQDNALTSPDFKPGPYLLLEVKDTGHGMDDTIVKLIFDPFFTTKGASEGTGLGLSVVFGIVKGHDGHITVQSKPGRGTTFSVYLPRIQATAPQETDPGQKVAGGSGESILFVDDEEMLVKLGRGMLMKLGYTVSDVTDSSLALEMFMEDPETYDLVVTDMTMPCMTGLELVREIRKIRPEIPAILCTGYSELINEEKAKQAGFNRFILKPVHFRELADAVRDVLAEQKTI
ncbi:MAG: PAS domain S-box protein [Syntrophales bacterium]